MIPPVSVGDPFAAGDAFSELNEEIDYIFDRLSGQPADQELAGVIGQHHEQLLQNLNQGVSEVEQVQQEIEDVINPLVDASIEANAAFSSASQLRLQQLQGALQTVKKEHDTLATQLKTSAVFLSKTREHLQELRSTARQLSAASRVQTFAPIDRSSDVLRAGSFLISRTYIRSGTQAEMSSIGF